MKNQTGDELPATPIALYRNLTSGEVDILLKRGCSARNWSAVLVKDGFSPGRVSNVVFSGTCALGSFTGTIDIEEGVHVPSGISDTTLHNCTIGNDVHIAHVRLLANYDIADAVVITNVDTLAVTAETAFGNGVQARVLSETGGRPLTLHDRITAQTAYLHTMYRHDGPFMAALDRMIARHTATRRSSRGSIGYATQIRNVNTIRNVTMGAFARIEGAQLLQEGTIASDRADATYVGAGVIAREFMILCGARIDTGAIITSSLAGQCVHIGKQFSAENSVFFANSEMFHGEACSVFAGPCSVSHHKSTLLIAGYLSFYNAGSGTNMSNHKYKLGAVHQGIMERGVKTGSSSYLLWPSRIGAFTTVIGRHYHHFDTGDFPFSFINEDGGKPVMLAGMNLLSVGLHRDARKWRRRDRRSGMNRSDQITFEMFSPHTVGGMVRALEKLRGAAQDDTRSATEYANFDGMRMKRSLIKSACKQYETAITVFIGEQVARRLESFKQPPRLADLRKALCPDSANGLGAWIDLCGMLAPKSMIDKLIADITADSEYTLERFRRELARIHGMYDQLAWNWCSELIQRRLGLILHEITPSQIITILTDWAAQTRKLNNLVLIDADKEFGEQSMTGYGIDGDAGVREKDFTAVRGTLNDVDIVKELRGETEAVQERMARLVGVLEGM